MLELQNARIQREVFNIPDYAIKSSNLVKYKIDLGNEYTNFGNRIAEDVNHLKDKIIGGQLPMEQEEEQYAYGLASPAYRSDYVVFDIDKFTGTPERLQSTIFSLTHWLKRPWDLLITSFNDIRAPGLKSPEKLFQEFQPGFHLYLKLKSPTEIRNFYKVIDNFLYVCRGHVNVAMSLGCITTRVSRKSNDDFNFKLKSVQLSEEENFFERTVSDLQFEVSKRNTSIIRVASEGTSTGPTWWLTDTLRELANRESIIKSTPSKKQNMLSLLW